MLYVQIMESYSMKVTGRVVDLEVKTRTNGVNGVITVNYPIVEYKLGEEKEMNRQSAGYDIVVEADDKSHMLYAQKSPHIGDKVTVMYNPNSLVKYSHFPICLLLDYYVGCFFLGEFIFWQVFWVSAIYLLNDWIESEILSKINSPCHI